MLSNNSLSQLTGTVGHTACSVNVGTGTIAQINYSFNIILLPQGNVNRVIKQCVPKKLS